LHDIAILKRTLFDENHTPEGKRPGENKALATCLKTTNYRSTLNINLKVNNNLSILHFIPSGIKFISYTNFIKVFKKIPEYRKLLSVIDETKSL